jgi:hypothetical protein
VRGELGHKPLGDPTWAGVRCALEQVFERIGLPEAIRSDNGAPFGSTGAGGLSALSVWWLKLSIDPRYIPPSSPQDNGRHERMHRTLKKETSKPPARTLPAHLADPWYDAGHEVRRVRPAGQIKWRGEEILIGEALAGELVGLAELGTQLYLSGSPALRRPSNKYSASSGRLKRATRLCVPSIVNLGSIRSTSAASACASSSLPSCARVAASQAWPSLTPGAREAHSRNGGSASIYSLSI